MKIILLHFIIITPFFAFGQINENTKGVSIAEDTLAPHESSILEVRSINKGVKFPSLTYEQITEWADVINSSGQSQPSNGLVVFVYSKANISIVELQLIRGFYYWKHNKNSGSGAWVQIASKKAIYPPGAIIAYSGKVGGLFAADGNGLPGTRMEGWHICNGSNGTPDLRAKFVTSFSDEMIGVAEDDLVDGYSLADFGASRSKIFDGTGDQQNNNERDFHFITKDEIPAHNHLAKTTSITDYINTSEAQSGSFASHTHPIQISQPTHTHKFVYTRREYKGNGWRDKRNAYVGVDKPTATIRRGLKWKSEDTRENNANSMSDPRQRTASTWAEVHVDVSKETIQFPQLSSDNISNNSDSECIPDAKYSKQKAIDLRPSYYVVLYLIKL